MSSSSNQGDASRPFGRYQAPTVEDEYQQEDSEMQDVAEPPTGSPPRPGVPMDIPLRQRSAESHPIPTGRPLRSAAPRGSFAALYEEQRAQANARIVERNLDYAEEEWRYEHHPPRPEGSERSDTVYRSQNRERRPARHEADDARRFELFLLAPGENKVDTEVDTRIPSSAIFTFNKEDHSMGNMLQERLLDHPHVTFAGYRVPHPLVPKFQLRVQTDGQVTPKDALLATCRATVADLAHMSKEFTKEFELKKMAGGGSGGAGPAGAA